MGRPRIPHVAALDGLRGVAVVAVVLFHAGHLRGGYLGVDVFFVLSGYLITALLLAEVTTTGGVGLGGFWARRARRLLPALAGVLLAVAAYAAVLAQPDELAQLRGDVLATMAYVANWRAILVGQDYWALFRSPSPLAAHVEPRDRGAVLPAVATAARRSPRVVADAPGARGPRGDDGGGRRVGGPHGGAVPGRRPVARLLRHRHPSCADPAGRGARRIGRAASDRAVASRARVALEVVALAGVGILAVAFVALDGHDPALYRGLGFVCALAVVAVIASVSHPVPLILGRLLGTRVLVVLGLLSYGIYLWHWPVEVVVTPRRVGLTGWPLVAVWCGLTLAAATTSYFLLERPVRRGAGAAPRRGWSRWRRRARWSSHCSWAPQGRPALPAARGPRCGSTGPLPRAPGRRTRCA